MAERLTELFAAEHGVDTAALERLDERDLEELEMTVLGRLERPFRVRAMNALVAARGAGAIGVLGEVLHDAREDPAVRAAAAGQLGRAGANAEPILIEALQSTPESTIRIAVAGALAKVGSPAALEPLEGIAAASEGALSRQARFATTVIAFRHGRGGHEPAPASEQDLLPMPEDERVPLSVREARTAEREAGLADLSRDSYGVSLAPETAFGVDCGPEQLLVALDRDLMVNLSRATSDPVLAGLVAWQDPVERTHSVCWLLLAWPESRGSAHLAVYRPSGHLFLSGRAHVRAKRCQFELQSVQGRGNLPVEIRGTIKAGTVAAFDGVAGRSRPRQEAPPLE